VIPEPVEKLLLLVALPLVPFSTVVWANAAPALATKHSVKNFLIFYFRRRIAPHAAIPTNNITPLEGSGTACNDSVAKPPSVPVITLNPRPG
jgi:hypothetical protein